MPGSPGSFFYSRSKIMDNRVIMLTASYKNARFYKYLNVPQTETRKDFNEIMNSLAEEFQAEICQELNIVWEDVTDLESP